MKSAYAMNEGLGLWKEVKGFWMGFVETGRESDVVYFKVSLLVRWRSENWEVTRGGENTTINMKYKWLKCLTS